MTIRPPFARPNPSLFSRGVGLGSVVRTVLALSLAGCASAVPISILGGGPGRPGDPRIFDDAVRGAQSAGYQPQQLDPEAGRFSLLARTDRTGRTRFVVQCFADGYVSVVPEGSRVTHQGEELALPPRVRDEYARVTASIVGAIEVRP